MSSCKTSVDAFATYEFCELPEQPAFDLVPGPAASWKAILPSLAVVGEPFRLAHRRRGHVGQSDRRGGRSAVTLDAVAAGARAAGTASTIKTGDGPRVIENLVADAEGDLELRLMADGEELARANPLRVVDAARRCAATGATCTGRAARPSAWARRKPISAMRATRPSSTWSAIRATTSRSPTRSGQKLNRLTAEFDAPGRFVCLPGYEWSGNTGMGGDRNIFYRHEGRPIRRSSHILVEGQTSTDAIYTADELFRALEGEDAVVIAHVGGRYADLKYAHDGRLERAVEVHSTWGTFEWLLHDAFEKGYRVGVVCHSDDHKGRPGATRPGASTFGAIGGLTCYFMPELTRDALFEALRQAAALRHDRHAHLPRSARHVRSSRSPDFPEDPQLGPAQELPVREALMGDIIRPGRVPMRLAAEVIGTAPIERVDVLHGTRRGANGAPIRRRRSRPARARAVAGRGVSRSRPRNDVAGQADAHGQSHRAFRAGELPQSRTKGAGDRAGHGARLEFGDDRQSRRHRSLARRGAPRHASCSKPTSCRARSNLATLADNTVTFDGGGLGRRISVYRLPEQDWSRRVALEHTVTVHGRSRSSGLSARDAERRPPSLVQPDLPDRVIVSSDRRLHRSNP